MSGKIFVTFIDSGYYMIIIDKKSMHVSKKDFRSFENFGSLPVLEWTILPHLNLLLHPNIHR